MPARPQHTHQAHRWAAGICAALLLAYAILAATAVAGKCPTADEPYHALAGWLHLWHGDFRLDTEDPPLWDTLAALATGPHTISADFAGDRWNNLPMDTPQEYQWQVQTLFRTPGNDADAFIARFRHVMLAVAVALGAMTAWFAWRLARAAGAAVPAVAAIVATALFALDPNFLAHGALMKNDVAAALAMLGLVITAWSLGRQITVRGTLALGIWIGVALGTKFTGPVLVPIVLVLLLARAALPEPWMLRRTVLAGRVRRITGAGLVLVLAGTIGWGVLWLSYGLHYPPAREAGLHLNLQAAAQRCALRCWQAGHTDGYTLPDPTPAELAAFPQPRLVTAALWIDSHHLLPQAFNAGLLYTYQSAQVRGEYLCGQIRCIGWWWYFPFAMLVKTPLATLAAFALAGVSGIFGKRGSGILPRSPGSPGEGRGEGDFEREDSNATLNVQRSTLNAQQHHPHPSPLPAYGSTELAEVRGRGPELWTPLCLGLPILIYLTAVMSSNLNLGLRHILPIYPLLFTATGLAAARLWAQRRRLAIGVGLVIGIGLASETIAAYPNFIPFFNLAAGGSRGGLRLLSDSNLDWGQDLPLLAHWQQLHPTEKLYLAYFGTADPADYGIRYTNLQEGYAFGPPPQPLSSPGVVAISATTLQGPYGKRFNNRAYYAGLYKLKPLEVLGGSIYLFNFPPTRSDRLPAGKHLID